MSRELQLRESTMTDIRELKISTYRELKRYLVAKLSVFGFRLMIEKEVDQPFGSMLCVVHDTESKESVRLVFDNRESWYVLAHNKSPSRVWNELAFVRFDNVDRRAASKAKNEMRGQINRYLRDLI